MLWHSIHLSRRLMQKWLHLFNGMKYVCNYFIILPQLITTNHNETNSRLIVLPKSKDLGVSKVHIFWEGHKILRNLQCRFDWHYIEQIYGGDFAKFCGLLRMFELYNLSKIMYSLRIHVTKMTESFILRQLRNIHIIRWFFRIKQILIWRLTTCFHESWI